MARSRLQQWLCFTGTELHKALFVPLFDPKTPDEAKTRALEKGESRFDYLNTYLTGREFLLDRFSVADAYLFTVRRMAAFSVSTSPSSVRMAGTRPSGLTAK